MGTEKGWHCHDEQPSKKNLQKLRRSTKGTPEEDAKKKQKEQTKKLKNLDVEIKDKSENYIERQIQKETLELFHTEDYGDIEEKIVETPMNGGNLRIFLLGKNTFQIRNGNEIVYPTTVGGDIPWYNSEWYRNKIKKALLDTCDLTKKEMTKIMNEMCKKVNMKMKELINNGEFLSENEDLQDILCEITKVTVIRSLDHNIYQIHIGEKTIEMTDRELYNGGVVFCIKYLTQFLKKIKISNEEWDEVVLPRILSKDILEPETEEVSSNAEIVTEKFLQYVRNKKAYDWDEVEKRKGYGIAIYYNREKKIVLISSNFVNKFFQGEKITRDYKITTISWAGHLHNKAYLVEKRTTEKIGGKKSTSFWHFDPEKLEVTKDDIEKEVENEQIETRNIEDFEGGDNNV